MTAETRSERMVYRLSLVEQAMIAEAARKAKMKPGPFARKAALEAAAGSQSPAPPAPPADPARGAELSMVNVVEGPGGTVQRVPPTAVERERIEREVAEAKLVDDAAREAFVERRTRELHGQGSTTPVARAMAESEWRNR